MTGRWAVGETVIDPIGHDTDGQAPTGRRRDGRRDRARPGRRTDGGTGRGSLGRRRNCAVAQARAPAELGIRGSPISPSPHAPRGRGASRQQPVRRPGLLEGTARPRRKHGGEGHRHPDQRQEERLAPRTQRRGRHRSRYARAQESLAARAARPPHAGHGGQADGEGRARLSCWTHRRRGRGLPA